MKKLILVTLLFLPGVTTLLAQGNWLPEKDYWPRTLIDSSQTLVQEIRDRIQRYPYDSLYASIVTASNISYASCSWEKQKARIARCAAFRFFIEGDDAYGDKAKEYMMVAEREDAGSIQEQFTNILWDSEIISMLSITYDFLKGNNYDFEGDEQTIRDRLQNITRSLYYDVIANDFGALHLMWVLGYADETNYAVKLASSLGMAAIVLNTETSSNTSSRPYTWISYAIPQLISLFHGYLVDIQGGWAEGPHYQGFSAVNFIPFAIAYDNFTDGDAQTFGGNSYNSLLDDYNFQRNAEWSTKVRMPDGSRPPIDDSFYNSFYYSGVFASIYEDDTYAWDYIHSERPYNTWASSSNMDVEIICLYDDAYQGYTEPSYTSVALPHSGQAILRSGWERNAVYMCVVGENGIARTGGRSHEHPDNGSFIIHALGEYLAMDCGYISWGEHDKVRYPENHNMILVNSNGPSAAGTYDANGTNAYIENFYDTPNNDYVEVTTNYQGVDITRCYTFLDNEIFVISDFLYAGSNKTYDWLLHGNGGGSTGGTFELLTDRSRSTIGARYSKNGVNLDCYVNAENSVTFSYYDDYHDDGTYNQPATHTVTKARTTGDDTVISAMLIPHESTRDITYEKLSFGTTIGGIAHFDDRKVLTLSKDYTYGISTLFDTLSLFFDAKVITISKKDDAYQPDNLVIKNGSYVHFDQTTNLVQLQNRSNFALHIGENSANGYVSESGQVKCYTGNEPLNVDGPSSYSWSDGRLTMQFDDPSSFTIAVNWTLHPIKIDSLSKTVFSADDPLTIYGSGFYQQGEVLFNSSPALHIMSWTDTEISLIVPEGVGSGTLFVHNMYGESNGVNYQILSPTGDPQVAQPIPNHVITAGTTQFIADLNVVFWDPNDDPLLYSVEYDSPYLTHDLDSLDVGLLYFSAEDNEEDTLFVTVGAMDLDSVSVYDQFIILVLDMNDPPQIDSIPVQNFLEDEILDIPFSYFDTFVSDPDNELNELIYSFVDYAPLNITTHIDSFVISAPENWFGHVSATFQVNDGEALSERDCEFEVFAVNDPPQLFMPDSVWFYEDGYIDINASDFLEDVDNDLSELSLTWSIPQYLFLEMTDWVLSITTIDSNWFGIDSLIFELSDSVRASVNDTMFVEVYAQNDPPYLLDSIPDFTRFEDFSHPISVQLSDYFSDPENDSLSFSYRINTGEIDPLLIDDLLQIHAVQNWFGSSKVMIFADDGSRGLKYLPRETATDSFWVHVVSVNDPPVITLPDSFTFFEDDTLSVSFADYLYDVDDNLQDLSLSYIDPQNIDINIYNMIVSMTNVYPHWNGIEEVTFIVTDDSAASASDMTLVQVLPQNDPPIVITEPDDIYTTEDPGKTFIVNLGNCFEDPDGDTLQYSVYSDSSAVLVGIIGDELEIDLTPNWFGETEITITADDGFRKIRDLIERYSSKDTVAVSFHVIASAVNDPPIIYHYFPEDLTLQIVSDTTIDFSIFADDIDSDTLYYSWEVNNVLMPSIENTFSYYFSQAGTYSVQGLVTDGEFSVSNLWHIEAIFVSLEDQLFYSNGITNIAPNPLNLKKNSPGVFYVSARLDEKVTCSVFNINGQFLGEIQPSSFSEENSQRTFIFEWDGRNKVGVILSPGLYLIKVNIGARTYVKKIILLN